MAGSPRWIVHPQDVRAHFQKALARSAPLGLSWSAGSSQGLLTSVTDEGLVWSARPAQLVPPRGTNLSVDYGWSGSHFHFASRVAEADGDRLRLFAPKTIELRDRRAFPRFRVPEVLRVVFHLAGLPGRPLPVQDISSAGLGLLVPDDGPVLPLHHIARGTLAEGDGRRAELALEIRNARPAPVDGHKVIGGRVATGMNALFADLLRRCAALAGAA